MNVTDAHWYRSPKNGATLELAVSERSGDSIISGAFTCGAERYEIADGIPDFTYPLVLAEPDAFARRIYDSVAPVYDEYLPLTFHTFGADEIAERTRMVDRLMITPGARVLEVGAGTGRTSRFIAERLGGRGQIVLHDISHAIILKARENLRDETVEVSYVVSNAVYLPFADAVFDAVFHFGGLNMFSDVKRALAEMVRVVRPGGRVVVGDESMPPWLRHTEFAKILINSSSHYANDLPLKALPVEAREVVIEYILGGAFYLLSFTAGEGEPSADFDFEIPGARGGTHRTRYYGQLEGVSSEAKRLSHQAREKRGVSMYRWLDDAVRAAALRDLA